LSHKQVFIWLVTENIKEGLIIEKELMEKNVDGYFRFGFIPEISSP
jgi:hypothetical protein